MENYTCPLLMFRLIPECQSWRPKSRKNAAIQVQQKREETLTPQGKTVSWTTSNLLTSALRTVKANSGTDPECSLGVEQLLRFSLRVSQCHSRSKPSVVLDGLGGVCRQKCCWGADVWRWCSHTSTHSLQQEPKLHPVENKACLTSTQQILTCIKQLDCKLPFLFPV